MIGDTLIHSLPKGMRFICDVLLVSLKLIKKSLLHLRGFGYFFIAEGAVKGN